MNQELYICCCGLTFSLICTLIVEGRQMCWTCQYLRPGQGFECTTSPANWTGGESRMKCPTKCIITADYETVSGEAKFFYRGCGESSQQDGCSEIGATYSCFFACEGNDYCNGQSLPKSPLLDNSPMQSAHINLPITMMILASLIVCVHMYIYQTRFTATLI
ncbi:hypothetical protein Btru_009643 [Bulinus truncatus]|nr:hypothetical protein Btru_009643 [Bulinus truncatus]